MLSLAMCLILAEGDNISADARVIEEYGLRTNNATLTGEAIPARKTADASLQSGFSELDRPNLIFAGTSVASGTGRAVVYATGMMTQFGRIAHLTQTIAEEPTPFQKELNQLSKVTAWIALGIGAIVAVVGYFSLGLSAVKEVTLLALGHRCRSDSRRAGRHADPLVGGCSSTSGEARRAGEETVHRGKARSGIRHLHRQKRHVDPKSNDRARYLGGAESRSKFQGWDTNRRESFLPDPSGQALGERFAELAGSCFVLQQCAHQSAFD